MDGKKERVCLACGELHGGERCPLVQKKINRYHKFTQKNFLMGNILLTCIKKEIDFFQILLEIAELSEETHDSFRGGDGAIMPIETAIEYFSISLNCNAREFVKAPEKTVEEYSKLISLTYFNDDISLCCDELGRPVSIDMSVNIDEYHYLNTVRRLTPWKYRYTLSKELIGDAWRYVLCLELPVAAEVYYLTEKSNREFFDNRLYIWDSIDFACATSIMLASEENGKLKDFFEKEFDNRWTENQLVKECTYDDSRFDLWMEHLEKATSDHLLDWRGYEHHFSTRYDNTDIEIEIDMNSSGDDCAYLYVRNQAGGLGIRFGHKTIETISFKEFVEKSYNSSLNNKEEENANKKEKAEPRYISKSGLRIIALARQIEKQIEYRKDNNLYSGLTKREIKHTDVIVTTQSMICHKKQHMITPLRGIVQLLTTQNEQVSYEIYVGFCVECNHYYVFKSDFDEMIKIGKPLCAVYQESIDGDEKQTYGSFRYKSQSVLNAMGYTVGMNDDLSATERQEILSKALQSKLIEIHDLLKFLNWLIRTRETQIKYRTAVSKWKEDVKFVEKYEKDMRDEIIVDSITVK